MKIGKKMVFFNVTLLVTALLIMGGAVFTGVSSQFAELKEKTQTECIDNLNSCAKKCLCNEAYAKIEAVQGMQKLQMEQFLTGTRSSLQASASSEQVQSVTDEFVNWYNTHKPEDAADRMAIDDKKYRVTYRKAEQIFKPFVYDMKFGDIYLLDWNDGRVLYSYREKGDMGISLKAQPQKAPLLAKAWQMTRKKRNCWMSDFTNYPFADGDVAFLTTPVVDMFGSQTGVLALQIQNSKLGNIVQQRSGMGKTGETYLVSPAGSGKFILRSDRTVYPLKTASVLPGAFSSELQKLQGDGGRFVAPSPGSITPDMNQVSTFGFMGNRWLVVSSISQKEALKATEMINNQAMRIGQEIDTIQQQSGDKILWVTLGTILTVSLLGSLATMVMSWGISKPLRIITSLTENLAIGDTSFPEKDLKYIEKNMRRRRDEIGQMTQSADRMREYFISMGEVASEIADGNLCTTSTPASDKDRLGISFSMMHSGLNNAFSDVRVSVGQVASSSEQLSVASQTLSDGATDQAASLEEINSSITELAQRAAHNARNAESARKLANSSRTAGEEGCKKMSLLADSLKELANSAEKINTVVKAIDDISFQTNLLALNAAVEAARAGVHGRGFAVVAEEVRNLASRSAKAAQDTTEMIENTVSAIRENNVLSTETLGALQTIVEDTSKVTTIAAEVASASSEQAKGVAQITIGINQIDQVTQSNTAYAEETAATALELNKLSAELLQTLQRFKLEENAEEGTLLDFYSVAISTEEHQDDLTDEDSAHESGNHLIA